MFLTSWKSKSTTSASNSRASFSLSHSSILHSFCSISHTCGSEGGGGGGDREAEEKAKEGEAMQSLVISDRAKHPASEHPGQHHSWAPGAPQAFQEHIIMEQEHKQQEEEDAGTENEGRTGEKEEKEAGKENVFFDILDVAGEALAL